MILEHVVIPAGEFCTDGPVPLAPSARPGHRSPWTAMAWLVLELELPCPHTVLLLLAEL